MSNEPRPLETRPTAVACPASSTPPGAWIGGGVRGLFHRLVAGAGRGALLCAALLCAGALSGCTGPLAQLAGECSRATALSCTLQSVRNCNHSATWRGFAVCVAQRGLSCASSGLARCALVDLPRQTGAGLVANAGVCDGEAVRLCVHSKPVDASRERAIAAVADCYRTHCGVP